MSELFVSLTHFLHGMAQMFFIFSFILLWIMKKRTRVQNLLMFCMFFWALLEFKDLFLVYPSYNMSGIWLPNFIFLDLLGIPVASFYFFEQIFPGRMTNKQCFKIILPFIVLILIYTIGYFIANDDYNASLDEILHNGVTFCLAVRLVYIVYSFVYLIVAAVIILRGTFKYDKVLHDNYSYTDNLNLHWIRLCIYLLAANTLLYIITCAYSTQIGDILFYVVSLGVWMFVYVMAMRQEVPILLQNYWKENDQNSKNVESLEQKSENKIKNAETENIQPNYINKDEMLAKLKSAFEEKKLHLNECLTISDLAAECGTNRTYLSNFFNNILNCTFYDYINKYRIENESKPMLADVQKNYTMEELATSSGFGSVSTFRRAFVKFVGVSPGKYKKSMLK